MLWWKAQGTLKPELNSRADARRAPTRLGLFARVARRLAAAALLLGATAIPATATGSEYVTAAVAVTAPPPLRLLEVVGDDRSGRTRVVEATLRALVEGEATCIELDLPGAGRRVLRLNPTGPVTSSRLLLQGCIEDAPGSSVIISIRNGSLAASIHLPGNADFAIAPQADGALRVERLDASRFPGCGVREAAAEREVYRRAARLQGEPPQPPPNPAGQDPVVLDLLVVYTPAARAGAGGTDGIAAQIDAAIEDTNLMFSNSLVPARVRLVKASEIDYRETGHAEDDLANLTEAAEHYGRRGDDEHPETEEEGWAALKPVPSLRRQIGADLVCLVVETSEETAGVANQMWRPERSFAPKALSVVQRSFLNRYHVLAHEIGHNLGCQHERTPGAMPGAFPFSYGYRFQAGGNWYRDLMATGPGLATPYFSSPQVTHLGVPVGIASDQPNAADNALTLSLTSPVAALFGDSLAPPPPPVRLVRPTQGSAFGLPAVVELEAEVDGDESEVAGVAFFAGEVRLGIVSRPPFALRWTNQIAGEVALRAEVTATTGSTNWCEPTVVRFSEPPSVRLTSPERDGWVPRDARLECRAEAADTDGHVARVEFYAGEYLVGVALAPPFAVTWTNTWGNRYVMTARAIDDMGVSATSAPVTLDFTPSKIAMDLLSMRADDDGRIGFRLAGPAGQNCIVEVSEDLVTWRPLVTVELEDAPREIRDDDPAPRGFRFYRIKPQGGASN